MTGRIWCVPGCACPRSCASGLTGLPDPRFAGGKRHATIGADRRLSMRRRDWLLTGAIGVAALCALSTSLAAPRFADLPGKVAPGSVGVDVELVLAVDISYSMDYDELKLQRDGYVEAITSPESLNALKQGMHGKIAVTLVEWAG